MNRSNSYSMAAKAAGLIFFLLITFGVAFWSSQFEPGQWYDSIEKPAWTPPGIVFPIVWTILYFSMALSAWIVWKSNRLEKIKAPLTAYFIQLLLNGLWSWLFFGRQMIGVALLDIYLLLGAILATTYLFLRESRTAGALFVPYLVWVAFASFLNLQIYILN